MKHNVKKVFIAGGTGFLGYYSAKLFLSKGVKVDTIALENELESLDWFDKNIGLSFGNLFEMSGDDIYNLLKGKNYDTFVYGLGPDERITPKAPAYDFFYDKLVVECKKICNAAKRAGIKRCVIMNSYFAYFAENGYPKLYKQHAYIRARVDQGNELISIGEHGVFDVMIMQLPYIFGTMPQRKPIWRESLMSHFDNYKSVMFPAGGGTTAIDVSGVAQAIVAAAYNGEHAQKYAVGNVNITFKELITKMMKYSNDQREYKQVPAWLCALGTIGLKRKNKKLGLENGLNLQKLMTGIQNKKFYVNVNKLKFDLDYDELGFDGGRDLDESLAETMKACYPERF